MQQRAAVFAPCLPFRPGEKPWAGLRLTQPLEVPRTPVQNHARDTDITLLKFLRAMFLAPGYILQYPGDAQVPLYVLVSGMEPCGSSPGTATMTGAFLRQDRTRVHCPSLAPCLQSHCMARPLSLPAVLPPAGSIDFFYLGFPGAGRQWAGAGSGFCASPLLHGLIQGTAWDASLSMLPWRWPPQPSRSK